MRAEVLTEVAIEGHAIVAALQLLLKTIEDGEDVISDESVHPQQDYRGR